MDYSTLPTLLRLEIEKLLSVTTTQLVNSEASFFASPIHELNTNSWVNDLDHQLVCWLRLALKLPAETGNTQNVTTSNLEYVAPALLVLVCGAVSGEPEKMLPVAAAVQFLHQASAIFDDIQDEDNPASLANQIGQQEALNVAMILFNTGHMALDEAISELTRSGSVIYPPDAGLLSKIVARGFRGQLLDLQEQCVPLELRVQNPQFYLRKLAFKTALTSSYLAELGARLGSVDNKIWTTYRQFGFSFGMALHILDDLRDFVIGRQDLNQSSDLRQRYLSLAFIYSFEEFKSRPEYPRLLKLWNSPTNSFEETRDLTKLFTSQNAFLQTLGTATKYLVDAEKYLRELDSNLEKIEHQLLLAKLQNFMRFLYAHFAIGNSTPNATTGQVL